MKTTKYFIAFLFTIYAGLHAAAQYKEPEKKDKIQAIYPQVAFDSLQAKKMLAKGTAVIKGVAFTRQKHPLGYSVPLSPRILANNMTVVLLPVTSYFEDWYRLRKEKESTRKRRFVYLSKDAYRYRLEAITNSDGEFTFPDMKPGRYFLQGMLDYTLKGSYNAYTGTGYNNYGGQTDYYQKKEYSKNIQDRIEEFVEIKENGEILKVKLH
ncbi:carboxypeptidase regulatory-like domain-containing protein [Pedobacter jeongneungensis]|uniref:carboxypeptidase regulatory-like domain-containing protein n=1 Tax=Pedobacter jeongneungensis TaxID=947309 RepID=UPI0004693585|nr:carboxypeptidase regulatory-like domain-containing protein [Pedobacter jeongneungensis]